MFNLNVSENEELRQDVKKNLSVGSLDPMAAYLGPRLWDSTISLPFDLDPLGVGIIQEVLAENDIEVDYQAASPCSEDGSLNSWVAMSPVSSPETDQRMP